MHLITTRGLNNMSGSLNKVTLIGNLGRDPEIRTTNDGKEIANFSLATSESWLFPYHR